MQAVSGSDPTSGTTTDRLAERSGPAETGAARSGWTPGGVRLFAALLITLQLVKGLSMGSGVANSPFTQSYFLITYHHGFVRRGLLGEVLRLAVGVPTRTEVDLVADVLSWACVIVLVALVEVLVRRRTPGSYAMALLVAASPFTIDHLLVDHRPDLFAIVVLAGLGAVLVRATRFVVPWIFGIGLAFTAMVLVHEDVLLIQIPWAIALVVLATLGRDGVLFGANGPGPGPELARRLGALLVAPVLATAVVLAYGLPSTHTVAELRADVAAFHLGPGTMFTYLPDSLGASVRLVASIPLGTKAHTLLLGGVLLLLQVGWVAAWVRPGIYAPFARRGNRGLGACVAGVILIATGALFATGVDWLRWFADCGAAWLVVQAFTVLLLDPRPTARGDAAVTGAPVGDRIRLSHWLPALAVYLAAVPPLAMATTAGLLRHYLFFS
ncbi:MAG: hypothetical protein ACLQPH_00745 [Acidimicrobiales bacterium]